MPIASFFLALVAQLRDVIESSVCSYNSKSHIDVQQSSSLLHDESGIESWPDLDVVSVQRMSACWVKRFRPDLLKPEASHHGVEEDFQEGHVVSVGVLHDLNPLDADFIFLALMFSIIGWEIGTLPERVKAESPVNEELQLFLDSISDTLEDVLSELLGVVRDLGLKLDSVLVDALDILLIEVNLEVVGEQLQSFSSGLWVTYWFLWEKRNGSRFHSVVW